MNSERLGQLIDAWRDNDLSENQAEELNQILRESEEARRTFSSESQLHGLLQSTRHGPRLAPSAHHSEPRKQ